MLQVRLSASRPQCGMPLPSSPLPHQASHSSALPAWGNPGRAAARRIQRVSIASNRVRRHQLQCSAAAVAAPKAPIVEEARLEAQVAVVLGAQWGDEGKGKLVDILAHQYDIVARAQVPSVDQP